MERYMAVVIQADFLLLAEVVRKRMGYVTAQSYSIASRKVSV